MRFFFPFRVCWARPGARPGDATSKVLLSEICPLIAGQYCAVNRMLTI